MKFSELDAGHPLAQAANERWETFLATWQFLIEQVIKEALPESTEQDMKHIVEDVYQKIVDRGVLTGLTDAEVLKFTHEELQKGKLD